MDKNMRRLLAALLISLAAALPAGAAYEDVGVSARVTGMGGAFTAVADDAYAAYYNPAGLATLSRPEFATTYAKLLTGLSDGSNVQNSYLAYAHPLDGGRKGTVAGSWNYFTLSGLYTESQYAGSYGRELFGRTDPGRWYLGGTGKILQRSVGSVPEASRAIDNTGNAVGADPVLQKASKTNMDLDFGVLWRVRPRWTAGFMVQHLTAPDVGFAESDKLGRNVKLGGAYHTPFTTLAGDVRLQAAPDGSTDKILAVAGEKWLPTLLYGSFGVRGGLGIGSRDFRQLSVGLSYKLRRMEFDYGFALPIGGMTSTSGSHRVGLTFRFGRSRENEASFNEAVLESLTDLAPVGTPEFRVQMDDLAQYKRTALEEFLRQAKVDATQGRIADAAAKLNQALALRERDANLQKAAERMNSVAEVYPEIKDYASDPAQAALLDGALSYATGDAKESLRKLAYAQTLKPGEPKLETLAKTIEAKTGESRAALAPKPEPEAKPSENGAEKLVSGLVALMEVALRERDFEKVVKYAEQITSVDPANLLAYKRLGAALYALKRYEGALKAMRAALKLERDPQARAQLKGYIDALSQLVERKAPAPEASRRGPTPQDIERLYESGVELYSQGRLSEAAAAFKRIVDADPSNVSARRAYDRVQTEILQTGGGR